MITDLFFYHSLIVLCQCNFLSVISELTLLEEPAETEQSLLL